MTNKEYVSAFPEDFIFYQATRYDVKGKQYLKTGDKYYVIDPETSYNGIRKINVIDWLLK